MEDISLPPRLPIHRVRARNFLSLERVDVELGALNVLAGPNGSGKSNFLKVFDFLGAVAERDLWPAIQEYGGAEGITFLNSDSKKIEIGIEGVITSLASRNALDEYTLEVALRPLSVRERGKPGSGLLDLIERNETFKFKRKTGPGRRISLSGGELQIRERSKTKRLERSEDVNRTTSGLSLLRKLGEDYEADQVEEMAQLFLSLRLVDIDVRRLRNSPRAVDSAYLSPTGSNVASFLLRLREEDSLAFDIIEEDMRFVLPTFEKFVIEERGGGDRYVAISVKEKPFADPIPLDRLSFGTIRAVVLFSMLNDPNPPKLTCIEEIDHGFHPGALDRLVERLREATTRTQIALATHSPALVNRMEPEELIMFSRDIDSGSTIVSRPDAEFVRSAREEYGYELGELWFAGLLDL